MGSDQKTSSQSHGHDGISKQEQILAKLLQGKEKEWTAIAERKTPLRLLDLPVDVLKEIIREITHTNDLTSLALVHPALHDLVIPLIYSRFDIVWPDAHASVESRTGVDALTYGLATLVMAQDVFGETSSPRPNQVQNQICKQCGHINQCSHFSASPYKTSRTRTRRGNNFAQYTRKFSLGNGPADWVQEYLITKEGGKMLGTLVALAVGRMRNLETFFWDMPTGVLRDVWLALASLADREDGEDCRLERIWVRWHDNSEAPPHIPNAPSNAPANPTLIAPAHGSGTSPASSGTAQSLFQIPQYPRVEFPTFSILPPLKSLSVLDVDELPYVEEMSVLIERSVSKLRELRIGIASHAQDDSWVLPAEDKSYTSASVNPSTQPPTRPGGVLGLLFGRFCSLSESSNEPSEIDTGDFRSTTAAPENVALPLSPHEDVQFLAHAATLVEMPLNEPASKGEVAELVDHVADTLESHDDAQGTQTAELVTPEIEDGMEAMSLEQRPSNLENTSPTTSSVEVPVPDSPTSPAPSKISEQKVASHTDLPLNMPKKQKSTQRLSLEVLELERVPISIPTLSRAIDWSRLTTLTILGCRNHEQLWRALQKRFTPEPRLRTAASSARITPKRSSTRSAESSAHTFCSDDYPLKITRLHTDAVSNSFIAFVKNTLAPDTVESLFLQDCQAFKTSVSIELIYRGAIRRHRGSLRKLLIDSELRTDDEVPDVNWRRWVLNREILTFVTSGKMPSLRELGLAIDYKDWHFFLQRLPQATQLRSLNVSHIAEYVHGRVDSREAAMQVLDVASLRPELELCYLGIQAKCFEILEYDASRKSPGSDISGLHPGHAPSDHGSDDDGDHHVPGPSLAPGDESDLELASSRGGETDDDSDSNNVKLVKQFKLREILFYDDKVSIFRARHNRL